MPEQIKIIEIVNETGASTADVISKALEIGITPKSGKPNTKPSSLSTVSVEEAEEIANYIMTGKSNKIIQSQKKQPIKEELDKTKELEQNKIKDEAIQITAQTEAPKIENTNNYDETVMPRRRGLKIIKKGANNEVIEPKENYSNEHKKQNTASLSELFSRNDEPKQLQEDFRPKQKKEKKKVLPKASNHGKVLEVHKESDEFKSSDDIISDNEVFLIDIGGDFDKKFDEHEDHSKPTNINVRSAKSASFVNHPQTLQRRKRKKSPKQKHRTGEEIKSVSIPEEIRVYEFAEKTGKTISEVMSKLFALGMMVTKNDFLDKDAIEILGEEFEISITIKDALDDLDYVAAYDEEFEESEHFETKPPVITIMGHVDHGKTSLLDRIRSSKVAAGEAGGITQHIGAYTITKNDQKITFLDTPGHEAFSAMRARGAGLTDIIVIVVAADDGVKPQTKEAIAHARASGAPILVAITKMDKAEANPDLVKTQMAENNMMPVEWGGDVEFLEVSSYSGSGIDDLLDTILIQAEVLELEADPTARAKAVIVESSLEKGRGPVATVIIQNGTLKIGDTVLADTTYGRVKAITSDTGKPLKELKLGETGQILGLNDVPSAGVVLIATENEKDARDIATKRAEHSRQKELSKSTKVSLEELSDMVAEGKLKTLPVIVKADVAGSLEAIKASLEKLRNDEVKVQVISAAVGGITESDLALASASEHCIILGFNVRPTGIVKDKAKDMGVQINTYRVIYDLIDEVRGVLAGMMSSVTREENTGQAMVRETFNIPKVGTIAGCFVSDGKVIRGGLARVIRDGVILHTTKISSLKRFKDDAKEVAKGYECGIMLEGFNDIHAGDYIETFIEIKEKVDISDV